MFEVHASALLKRVSTGNPFWNISFQIWKVSCGCYALMFSFSCCLLWGQHAAFSGSLACCMHFYHTTDDWPGSFLQALAVDLTVSIPLSRCCCCCLSSLMTCCVMEGNFIHSLLLLVQLSIYLSCHLLLHLQRCIVEHECCSSFLFIDLIVSSHWQLLFPWRIACIFCHLTLSVCWSCL